MSRPARYVATTTPTAARIVRSGTPRASAASQSRSRRVSGLGTCSDIATAWQVPVSTTCKHERMSEASPVRGRHRRRLRREVRWGITAFLLLLVVEYLVIPELTGARRSIHLLGQVNVAYLILAFALEGGALFAYARLTHTVLPRGGPNLWRLFRR